MRFLVRLLQRIYKFTVSPVLHWMAGPGAGCRFEPSCSEYFAEAVEVHGFLRGARLGLGRICRCNPWCAGGWDPVMPGGKQAQQGHQPTR
jgi:uncharacterized protein